VVHRRPIRPVANHTPASRHARAPAARDPAGVRDQDSQDFNTAAGVRSTANEEAFDMTI
jgi:hypothetical protein